MIRALENLDANQAAAALSLAARRFLPQSTDDGRTAPRDLETVERIIAELSGRTAVRGRRSGGRVNSVAFQEELSREISAYFLNDADQQQIRARVGDKGALSPSLYRVFFSPKFENGKNFWGLSKTNIEGAISRCDRVQHFHCQIEGPQAVTHASLFTLLVSPERDPYTTVVRCQRMGAALTVDEAYRVYHSEVDLIGASTPLELLTRFLERFGIDTELSIVDDRDEPIGPPTLKLMFHEEILQVQRGQSVVIRNASGTQWRIGPVHNDGPMEVTLSFSVNTIAYVEQLARHGIKAEIPTRPLEAFTYRSSASAAVGVSTTE